MSRFRGKYWGISDLATGDVPISITPLPLPLPTVATGVVKSSLQKLLSPELNNGLEEPVGLDGRHIGELVNTLRRLATIIKKRTVALCDGFQAPETTAGVLWNLTRLFIQLCLLAEMLDGGPRDFIM